MLRRRARRPGCRCPSLVASSTDAPVGSAFMVSPPWRARPSPARSCVTNSSPLPAGAAGQFGEALAQLHTIDPATVPGLRRHGPGARCTAAVLDRSGEPHPAFELAFKWLDEHRPAAVPAHVGARRLPPGQRDGGRRRPARRARLGARAHRRPDGGPRLAVREGVAVRPARPVAGVGTYDQLLDAYEEASGTTVDPDGGAVVGGARHAEVGHHVHRPGRRPRRRASPAATSWRPSAGGCARTSTTCSWRWRDAGEPARHALRATARRGGPRVVERDVSSAGRRSPAVPRPRRRERARHGRARAAGGRRAQAGATPNGWRSWAATTSTSSRPASATGEFDDRLPEVRELVWATVQRQAHRRQPDLPRSPRLTGRRSSRQGDQTDAAAAPHLFVEDAFEDARRPEGAVVGEVHRARRVAAGDRRPARPAAPSGRGRGRRPRRARTRRGGR